MTGFTILGAFVSALIVAAIVIVISGFIAEASSDPTGNFKDGCVFGMGFLLIILIFAMVYSGITFSQNPESYGYTRIEQEEEASE